MNWGFGLLVRNLNNGLQMPSCCKIFTTSNAERGFSGACGAGSYDIGLWKTAHRENARKSRYGGRI